MKTEVLLDHEQAMDGAAHRVRVLLRIEGEPPASGGRSPLDLSVIPDRSGSMSGEKLARAREAALLSLRAQNLAVELRAAPAARLARVHHGDPRTEVAGGVRLELGDLYAGQPRLILAEFVVAADDPDAEAAVAVFTVTADVLTDGGIERQEIRLPVRTSFAGGPRIEPAAAG